MTFKNGKRFDANMTLGQEESNWFLQIAEDHVPERASKLSEGQRAFLELARRPAVVDLMAGNFGGAA